MSDQCNDENEGIGDEFENGAKGEAASKMGKVKKGTDIPNPGYRLVNRKYRGKQRWTCIKQNPQKWTAPSVSPARD